MSVLKALTKPLSAPHTMPGLDQAEQAQQLLEVPEGGPFAAGAVWGRCRGVRGAAADRPGDGHGGGPSSAGDGDNGGPEGAVRAAGRGEAVDVSHWKRPRGEKSVAYCSGAQPGAEGCDCAWMGAV
ncbi:hypothetical protein PMKS-003461 [Pichia membranifaciens]|uniref:Uncharacterized protein n=1 Tax=Pichia membranifaciens TaxID=4926 RepID=A0A1Q2YKA6_9ASCO|nr:hypothetical protein PMKS-003461 [Pichia membranifaciens]